MSTFKASFFNNAIDRRMVEPFVGMEAQFSFNIKYVGKIFEIVNKVLLSFILNL